MRDDGIAPEMFFRYVVQRDLDGSWSVRETATNSAVSLRGSLLVGLSVAANHARKLNNRVIEIDGPPDEATPREESGNIQ